MKILIKRAVTAVYNFRHSEQEGKTFNFAGCVPGFLTEADKWDVSQVKNGKVNETHDNIYHKDKITLLPWKNIPAHPTTRASGEDPLMKNPGVLVKPKNFWLMKVGESGSVKNPNVRLNLNTEIGLKLNQMIKNIGKCRTKYRIVNFLRDAFKNKEIRNRILRRVIYKRIGGKEETRGRWI